MRSFLKRTQHLLQSLSLFLKYLRPLIVKTSGAVPISIKAQSDETEMAHRDNNLATLHGEEERLYVTHLEQTANDGALLDHIYLIREAMNMIFTLTHDHVNKDDNELVMQYLGIRMFNTMASSIKLAHSGYYQSAFSCLRDFLETYFLIDYFGSFPAKIQAWKVADEKQLKSEYGPGAIRNALDTRDKFTEKNRKKLYDMISHYATHATPSGFHLVTMNDLGKIGPFHRPEMFIAWMQEAVKMCCNSGLVFGKSFKDLDARTTFIKTQYTADLKKWQVKYLPKT